MVVNYLWNEVLFPGNLLRILQRFIHLEIKGTEDGEGRKLKKEVMTFPRYHQWDVVNKLLTATLAAALEHSKPIIIVTIQTFPHVLKAIENSVSLKERNYAIIADEAHSSQTGSMARQLKEVLMKDSSETASDNDEDLSADDVLNEINVSRRASPNLSYFAFTATPKAKTDTGVVWSLS